jgi:uncharacterized membrane-anchored protein YitT (DUF2179 family)
MFGMEDVMLEKMFNWGYFKFFKCIFGITLTALAVNLFIVPNNLYTGGILGVSQLLRNLIINIFHLDLEFDISSIIYYLINIPLLFVAYKKISKQFLTRTLFTVTINSLLLMTIPIPDKPLVENLLTNVLIGGIMAGIGYGMVLSTGSSSGGTDIIGLVFSKKSKLFSVGNIGLLFNAIVYILSGIFYGVGIMIYSIIYSSFESILIDRNHSQNIFTETFIFTKKDPSPIINFIIEVMGRDATYWVGKGGYTGSKFYIIYTVLSKYERMRLERHIKEFDDKAFLSSTEGASIKGEFEKHY